MTAAENREARQLELTKCERRIRDYLLRLLAVAKREDRAFVWPSADTIANACGCCRSTVTRAKERFRALGLFAFSPRYRVVAGIAWRLPDAIYASATAAFLRPAPRVTGSPQPTRRERFTNYVANTVRRLTAAPAAPAAPRQDCFIFAAASTIPSIEREPSRLIDRSKSPEALAGFLKRRSDRLK